MGKTIRLLMDIDTGNEPYQVEFFNQGITGNLAPMFAKAGVYDALFESYGKQAGEIVAALRAGIARLEDHPAEYRLLNPKSGWGSYESALQFLRDYMQACAAYPKARIYSI